MNIKFENVSFYYNEKLYKRKEVLKNINFKISAGEFIGLVGPSGSGKTTLLQHFTGLLQPTSGKITVDGRDIWDNNFNLKSLCKRIGLVFQFPETQLFEDTIFKDVAFGPKSLHLNETEIELRVNQALRSVGLDEQNMADRSPHQVSEGEKRRIALAGVLAMAPEMLVLDEPTAGLDYNSAKKIISILKNLNKKGTTILLISHDLDIVFQLAKRIIILYDGIIYFDGNRNALFSHINHLKNANLEIPQIIKLAKFLKEINVISDWKLYSINQLKRKI